MVKVRRVGNSTVITVPAGLAGHGFEPGAAVLVELMDDGTLRVIPVPDVDAHVRDVARAAIQRRRHALEILRAHEEGGAASPNAISET
jgi:antitoxin component of MazEF toxin-antitoxin module